MCCCDNVPSEESAPDLLIQLYWQKIDESDKTEFVAQGGYFETANEMYRWIRETVESRKSECPEGWHPMLCDARSKYFLPNAGG